MVIDERVIEAGRGLRDGDDGNTNRTTTPAGWKRDRPRPADGPGSARIGPSPLHEETRRHERASARAYRTTTLVHPDPLDPLSLIHCRIRPLIRPGAHPIGGPRAANHSRHRTSRSARRAPQGRTWMIPDARHRPPGRVRPSDHHAARSGPPGARSGLPGARRYQPPHGAGAGLLPAAERPPRSGLLDRHTRT